MLWWTLRQLRSSDWKARIKAARKLGKLRELRSVDPLIQTLKDQDYEVRIAVIEALGQINNARAVMPIADSLSDYMASVRVAGANSLGQIARAEAVNPLIAALGDRNGEVRRAVATALESLGWQPEGEPQRARQAFACMQWAELVKLGNAAIEPLLDAALHDEQLEVREAAAKTLAKIGGAAREAMVVGSTRAWHFQRARDSFARLAIRKSPSSNSWKESKRRLTPTATPVTVSSQQRIFKLSEMKKWHYWIGC